MKTQTRHGRCGGAEVIVINLESGLPDGIANVTLHGRAAELMPQLL